MNACVFVCVSKVLVQFEVVTLVRDESKSDSEAPTKEEKGAEKTAEEEEEKKKNEEEGTKSKTVEEMASEENGESGSVQICSLSLTSQLLFLICHW